MNYVKVRLETTGQEMYLLDDNLENDSPLVEDIEDYVEGRESFGHWFPREGVFRHKQMISREITKISESSPLPEQSEEGMVRALCAFLDMF